MTRLYTPGVEFLFLFKSMLLILCLCIVLNLFVSYTAFKTHPYFRILTFLTQSLYIKVVSNISWFEIFVEYCDECLIFAVDFAPKEVGHTF